MWDLLVGCLGAVWRGCAFTSGTGDVDWRTAGLRSLIQPRTVAARASFAAGEAGKPGALAGWRPGGTGAGIWPSARGEVSTGGGGGGLLSCVMAVKCGGVNKAWADRSNPIVKIT